MFAICPRSLCRTEGCAPNGEKHPMFSEDHEYLGRCPTTSAPSRSRKDEQDCSRDKPPIYHSLRQQSCPSSVLDRMLAGRCSELPNEQEAGAAEPKLLRDAMMTFIRTLLRGICIEVLLDDGSSLFPEASLDYELAHLILEVNEAQRSIPLRDVEDVVTPEELRARNILTSIQPFLDERCCTLIIKEFEFVTFRFDTKRLREYFATCLLMLISRGEDGRDGEVLVGAVSNEVHFTPRPQQRQANAVEALAGSPVSASPAVSSLSSRPESIPGLPRESSGLPRESPKAESIPGLPRESSRALPSLGSQPEGATEAFRL